MDSRIAHYLTFLDFSVYHASVMVRSLEENEIRFCCLRTQTAIFRGTNLKITVLWQYMDIKKIRQFYIYIYSY